MHHQGFGIHLLTRAVPVNHQAIGTLVIQLPFGIIEQLLGIGEIALLLQHGSGSVEHRTALELPVLILFQTHLDGIHGIVDIVPLAGSFKGISIGQIAMVNLEIMDRVLNVQYAVRDGNVLVICRQIQRFALMETEHANSSQQTGNQYFLHNYSL